MSSAGKDIATALTFLTRLPVAGFASGDPAALSRSSTWFPLVGLLIGAILGVSLLAALAVAPVALAVILVLILSVLLTGGFHEDGLADVADSAGAFTVDSKLAIMRDSRVGTYGALALVLLIAARFTALSELADSAWGVLLGTLIAAHVLGRWSSVLLMAWLPYARAEAANKIVAQGVTRSQFFTASLVSLACLIPVAVMDGQVVLIALPTAGLVATVAGLWFRRSFGGITGDALGAANVIVELSVLCTVVIAHSHLG